ncbi:uncharacterized protein TNCV_3820501 [Trichonephila clavipes]|nr:uncharacterized protein TNCV_3820501 [Trichonephila clavipes]
MATDLTAVSDLFSVGFWQFIMKDSRLNNAFKLCNFISKIMVDFHKRILFSDEAHIWLNGYVSKQNCRIWSEANPTSVCRNTVTSRKTDCLVRFIGWWNHWSYFFKNDEGHNDTVNGDRYRP